MASGAQGPGPGVRTQRRELPPWRTGSHSTGLQSSSLCLHEVPPRMPLLGLTLLLGTGTSTAGMKAGCRQPAQRASRQPGTSCSNQAPRTTGTSCAVPLLWANHAELPEACVPSTTCSRRCHHQTAAGHRLSPAPCHGVPSTAHGELTEPTTPAAHRRCHRSSGNAQRSRCELSAGAPEPPGTGLARSRGWPGTEP